MIWKGFYGWTSYWSTVYYRTEAHTNTQTLRNHELKHVDQMKEEGNVVFTVGYKANPSSDSISNGVTLGDSYNNRCCIMDNFETVGKQPDFNVA